MSGRFARICMGMTVMSYVTMVMAQDAFPVKLTATPNYIPVGTLVNLSCTFKMMEVDLKRVKFLENDLVFFDHPGSSSRVKPQVVNNGSFLSSSPETDSVVWVTIRTHQCVNPLVGLTYKCVPLTTFYKHATGAVKMNFTEPSRHLYINGTKVPQREMYKLGPEAVDRDHHLKFETSNERNPVTGLSLTIGNKTFSSFKSKTSEDVCSHHAVLETTQTFSEGIHTVHFTVERSDGTEHVMFEISVKGNTESPHSKMGLPKEIIIIVTVCCAAVAITILIIGIAHWQKRTLIPKYLQKKYLKYNQIDRINYGGQTVPEKA